jgi:hypothetical protein
VGVVHDDDVVAVLVDVLEGGNFLFGRGTSRIARVNTPANSLHVEFLFDDFFNSRIRLSVGESDEVGDNTKSLVEELVGFSNLESNLIVVQQSHVGVASSVGSNRHLVLQGISKSFDVLRLVVAVCGVRRKGGKMMCLYRDRSRVLLRFHPTYHSC